MKKYSVVFCLLFFCSLSFAGLSIDPSIVNISGIQGSYCKNAYSVTNTGNEPVKVSITLTNGISFSENVGVNVEDWLKFEKTEFDLNPKEQIEVPYEVFISSNMKGSVCGKIDFFSQEENSMIDIVVSVPIYIIVKDTENIDFKIDSIEIDRNETDKNLYYKMVIKNDGNVHIRHSGKIQIYDSKKEKELDTIDIEETVPTYCEQTREFIEKFSQLEEGTYVAVFTIEALNKQATKEVKFKVSKDKVEINTKASLWDLWKNFIKNHF